jgi:hypothetical protein
MAAPSRAQSKWWMDEPIRFLQTNLRETDSTVDPKVPAQQVADFPANTLLLNMGGIVAQYPTQMPFHVPSRHLPHRQHALTILSEALERYDVDGLFIQHVRQPVHGLQRRADGPLPLRGVQGGVPEALRPRAAGDR